MTRNPALRALQNGDFAHMSREDFMHWVRDLEHAPTIDQPEEPVNNDQQHVEEPAIPDNEEMFTEDEVEAIGGAIGMMAAELRAEFRAWSLNHATDMFYHQGKMWEALEAKIESEMMVVKKAVARLSPHLERSDDNVLLPNIKSWRRAG